MAEPRMSFAEHFAGLPDPRVARTRKHLLLDILAVQLIGMGLLAELIIHRTPSADTSTLVVRRLGPTTPKVAA